MVSWLTANELAELRVPGLPTSKRKVNERAKREGWPSRPREGKGGQREFPVLVAADSPMPSVLTPEQQEYVRRVLAERQLAKQAAERGEPAPVQPTPEERAEALAELRAEREAQEANERAQMEANAAGLAAMTGAARQRLHSKIAILDALAVFISQQPPRTPQRTCLVRFTDAYAAGTIPIDPEVRAWKPTVSADSLIRWVTEARNGRITNLKGRYGHRKGQGVIDRQPEMVQFIESRLFNAPHKRNSDLYVELIAHYAKREDVTLPSLRRLEAWVKDWKKRNASRFLAAANPDAWRNSYELSLGDSTANIQAPNQLWMADSSPADVMFVDGRHSLVAIVDVYTRRARILVTRTSNSEAIGLALRDAITEWGVMKGLKVDNGSDYKSIHIRQFLYAVGVDPDYCTPYTPREKGIVERFFGTFTGMVSERLEGYIGHNVAQRKAIESRKSFAERLRDPEEVIAVKMTAAEFQAHCDEWLAGCYHQEPHAGLGGHSPAQVYAAYDGPPEWRIENMRALDALLMKAPNGGKRMVGKKGIRIEGVWYFAEELIPYVGQWVDPRLDPKDLGRVVVYGGPNMEFLCIAVNVEWLGVERAEFATTMRKKQAKLMREWMAEGRKLVRQVKPEHVLEEVRAKWRENSNRVVAFRKEHLPFETPELAAAAASVEALDAFGAPRAPHAEEDLIPGRQQLADFEEERLRRLDVEEPLDKYKRLKDKADAGLSLDKDETRFMRNFETTRDYRGYLNFLEATQQNKET